jgi:hypothetical protein
MVGKSSLWIDHSKKEPEPRMIAGSAIQTRETIFAILAPSPSQQQPNAKRRCEFHAGFPPAGEAEEGNDALIRRRLEQIPLTP